MFLFTGSVNIAKTTFNHSEIYRIGIDGNIKQISNLKSQINHNNQNSKFDSAEPFVHELTAEGLVESQTRGFCRWILEFEIYLTQV